MEGIEFIGRGAFGEFSLTRIYEWDEGGEGDIGEEGRD